jgi:hypothetical protein
LIWTIKSTLAEGRPMLALRLSALGLLCMTRAGSSGCGTRGQDRDVGVLDLIRHGLLERGDAAVDLGDGQTRLEAQHDLDKDDAA